MEDDEAEDASWFIFEFIEMFLQRYNKKVVQPNKRYFL